MGLDGLQRDHAPPTRGCPVSVPMSIAGCEGWGFEVWGLVGGGVPSWTLSPCSKGTIGIISFPDGSCYGNQSKFSFSETDVSFSRKLECEQTHGKN